MSFFPGQDPAAGDKYPVRGDQGRWSCRAPPTSATASRCAARCRRRSRAWSARSCSSIISARPCSSSGNGLDVRPHPHIGLATVTYLFDGEIMHRDSLGTAAPIRPGEVNWMTAGRGIVHSERTGPERRAKGDSLHGLQMWVALPAAQEEMAPDFAHHAVDEFPMVRDNGKTVRVVVGQAYGAALAGQDHVGDAVRRRASRRPAAPCRSTPITRSARSTCSTARSTSPATSSAATACWCSSPATPSPSAR